MFDFGALLLGLGIGGLAGASGVVYVMYRTDLLQNWLFEQVTDLMEQLPAIFASKPELIDALVEPILFGLQKSVGGGEMKDLKIAGFKIPPWAVQLGLSFLQSRSAGKGAGTFVNAANQALTFVDEK